MLIRRRRRSDGRRVDLEKHDEVTVTKSDALATTAVPPTVEAPPSQPPSVFGALVVDIEAT
jgi:hypothetical protein